MCEMRGYKGQRYGEPLTEDQLTALEDFLGERRRDFKANPPRGLRPPTPLSAGWQCPNCGKAHAPDVSTCPDPPAGRGLRDRISHVSNG